jgi:hypothetical protein
MEIGTSTNEPADGGTHEFFPLWAQKSFGLWTTFGGGGYRINPGHNKMNSWFAGWAILRQLGERFQLGTEIYGETAETRGDSGAVGFNVGAILDLNQTWHLVSSAGSSLSGKPSYYFALEWTL